MSCVYKGGSQDHVATWTSGMAAFFFGYCFQKKSEADAEQLVHPSALISLLLVILTAVLQIVCLNRAIVCADTVVVVPLFYAGYTVFGLVSSLGKQELRVR